MNTAMFMQLWHSKSNNQEQVLKDEKILSFEYYKDKALDTTIFPGVVAAMTKAVKYNWWEIIVLDQFL